MSDILRDHLWQKNEDFKIVTRVSPNMLLEDFDYHADDNNMESGRWRERMNKSGYNTSSLPNLLWKQHENSEMMTLSNHYVDI